MNTFTVHILAADRVLYEGECESLVIPTPFGQYGILAHHCKAICAVVSGSLTYTLPGGEKKHAAVSEGLAKVNNNDVLVLLDTAEKPEEIDINAARLAADEAREKILQNRSIREHKEAEAALARALSRIDVQRRYKD